MSYVKPPKPFALLPKTPRRKWDRTDDNARAAAKYSFLASWSNACKWKRATWLFTVSLVWCEVYRTSDSKVIYDVRVGRV
jgi:hypothetical protein